MVSKVDIYNIALQDCGVQAISEIDEATVEAREANLRYDTCRRALLRAHPWNFAMKRAVLAKDTDTPAFGYESQFTLPSDLVRMFATDKQMDFLTFPSDFNGFVTISNRNDFVRADDYKVEGNKLLSNDDVKKILYIADVDEPQLFDEMFVEMLAKNLAARIAHKLTNDKKLKKSLTEEAKIMEKEAQTVDGQEDIMVRTERSAFVQVRGSQI